LHSPPRSPVAAATAEKDEESPLKENEEEIVVIKEP